MKNSYRIKKEKALDWWGKMTIEQRNDIERKYGYYGHNIGTTEEEVVEFWEWEIEKNYD